MERISGGIGEKQELGNQRRDSESGNTKYLSIPIFVNPHIYPVTTEYPVMDDRRPEWNRFAKDSLFRTGLVS